jgi:hypothetical protein
MTAQQVQVRKEHLEKQTLDEIFAKGGLVDQLNAVLAGETQK